jgi:hypothetical protein
MVVYMVKCKGEHDAVNDDAEVDDDDSVSSGTDAKSADVEDVVDEFESNNSGNIPHLRSVHSSA